MLYLSRCKAKFAIFVLWLTIYEYRISYCELLQEILSVEPHCLCIRTIGIYEDCFDQEFFIPRHLTREELDPTLHHLFVGDIK